MRKQLHDAQELIDEGRYEEAVALLCRLGPPEGKEICELIAKAYHGKNQARGDIYTAKVFAEQAITHGSEDPAMQEIIAWGQRNDSELEHSLKSPEPILGGPLDTRPEADSPYSFCAMSKLRGKASAPKDFEWLDKNIPCQEACPASTDIPAYLDAIYRGEHEKAYRINLECNIFPAVLGRVCARPCESECRHGWDGLGKPVAICFSKRSAADFGGQESVVLPKWFADSGKKVAVVGGGPAGLAAARQLALYDHAVTVYEKHSEPGGMMNQGIPVFRLPRDIIKKEIDQIRELGVEIVCNAEIGKTIALDELARSNDAVILAAGTLRPNILNLPGKELDGIRHGLDFLLEVNSTGTTKIGKEVVVIGGGFTAMDCARTAKRLGAKVSVYYRRSIEEMLVTPGELEELEHEGIPLETQVTPKGYIGKDGHVTAVQFVRTELGEPDDSGRRRPIEMKGSEFNLPVDGVLLATGQFPDTTWIDEALRPKLAGDDGWLLEQSQIDSIFFAGDFKNGANSLIDAIGHAKDCAREVDQFLMGEERIIDVAEIEDVTETGRIREMDAVELQPMPAIDLEQRDLTAEVETGFELDTSRDEAQRCYQCHYKFEIDNDKCIYCDWCVKSKPRPDCILKVKTLHYDDEERIVGWEIAETQDEVNMVWINQEDCIRCGACVAACPVDAISIQKVSLKTIPQV